ncbi:MAG: hypothetical protein IIV49_02470 [Alistipes sp.]|nr:hypothetical protein [Alistipes sp.]
MKQLFISLCALVAVACSTEERTPVLLFDKSHGQCLGSSYTADVVPDYEKMAADNGAEFVVNEDQPLNEATLAGVDVVLMLSPLQHDLQKNITTEEATALVNFINRGGSLIVFVDEESHRVHLEPYNINAVTTAFGVEFGYDNKIAFNNGAVSFENDIFKGRYEVPCTGMRSVKGGIPASVCMDDGFLHASYVELENGGKLFACAETMVALLMGGDEDIERKGPTRRTPEGKMTQTGWFGKDSRQYMADLIAWSLK